MQRSAMALRNSLEIVANGAEIVVISMLFLSKGRGANQRSALSELAPVRSQRYFLRREVSVLSKRLVETHHVFFYPCGAIIAQQLQELALCLFEGLTQDAGWGWV